MRFLILLALMLASCVNFKKPTMSFEEADLKLSEEWMYADKVEGLRYNGEVMTRPPGFEQLVMSLNIPSVGGLLSKRHCVYYEIPYKEKPGKIRVQETKSEVPCPDTSTDDAPLISLDNINNFKVTMANYRIILDFEMDKNKKRIEVPLINVESGLVHEKYKSIKEKRLISGLRLLRLTDESFDLATNKYLGKLSDRFSRGSAIRCHQVNKDCETIGENRCEQCRYGWYEVVDFQCTQGGSKFCGQNHCGEKNEPACPRGVKVVEPEEAGICQNDLEPTPNLEKILVCQ